MMGLDYHQSFVLRQIIDEYCDNECQQLLAGMNLVPGDCNVHRIADDWGPMNVPPALAVRTGGETKVQVAPGSGHGLRSATD